MMKALQTFLVLTFCAVALEATAQATGISIETVMVHDGSIDASLDGYTTYRIYADVSSEFDFVSSVFGDATLDDGTCLFELSVGCALDTDNDGLVGTTDLLELLAYFGMTCE